MKIFGREPALVVGFVAAVVAALVALNIPGLSAEVGAALTTLIGGIVIAATTRPWAPGLFAGLVASGAALLTGWGMHVSDAQVAMVSALVMAGFALFAVRPQVTPVKDAVPISPDAGRIR